MYLIDTHTHFDVPEYDNDREQYNQRAYDNGVRHLVLIGLLANYFEQMVRIKKQADNHKNYPSHHLAFGLHPLYIKEQSENDLVLLENYIKNHKSIAIAEIGLDTYPDDLKDKEIYQKQQRFFIEQISLAKKYDLPIMLHIRKAHGDALRILKEQKYHAYELGGIAHSFSGGANEALAFVKMGFKIGITGQITNPNAKKLRNAIKAVFDKYGTSPFVIETDSPDMVPVSCQINGNRFNEPANLIHVLNELALMFNKDKESLAYELWQNTNRALNTNFDYPKNMMS